jgi:hypothetical protein
MNFTEFPRLHKLLVKNAELSVREFSLLLAISSLRAVDGLQRLFGRNKNVSTRMLG